MSTPGAILRERRRAHGLTQGQLALRAGSTQAAVSRLERDELSPTVETFARLLAALGESFAIEVHRDAGGPDDAHLADLLARTPTERLELAIGWNRLAGEVTLAGRRARDEQNA